MGAGGQGTGMALLPGLPRDGAGGAPFSTRQGTGEGPGAAPRPLRRRLQEVWLPRLTVDHAHPQTREDDAEKGLEAPVPSYKMETFSHSEGTQPIARPPCTQKGLVPRRVCFPPRSTPGTSSPWIRSPTFLDLFLSVGSGKTGWRQVS